MEPLSWYLTDAEELSWVTRIYVKRSKALAKTHLRGLVILHKPGFLPHELTANYTIITADGLAPEEERFVVIKELMHIYFGPEGGGVYATSSEIELENLINELFVGSLTKSRQTAAETKALWMAISVLVREKDRRETRKQFEADPTKLPEIAHHWRLTERRASLLFSDRYSREVESLLG